jgi:hypothetical protein
MMNGGTLHPWLRSLLCLICLAALAGCGPATATISGEVTVDGQPLKKGFIMYSPADGIGQPVTAPIEDGRYHVKTVLGNKFVQISEPVVIAKHPEAGDPTKFIEQTQERLPERYHVKSELTFEAKAGANTKDWKLESN